MVNSHIVEEHVFLVLSATLIITLLFFMPAFGNLAQTTIIRTISSSNAQAGSSITITLSLTNINGDNFVLIEENPPPGSAITNTGTSQSTQSGVLRWADLSSPVPDQTLTYEINVPSTAGTYLFGGTFMTESSTLQELISGDDTITVTAAPTPTGSGGSGGGGGGGGGAGSPTPQRNTTVQPPVEPVETAPSARTPIVQNEIPEQDTPTEVFIAQNETNTSQEPALALTGAVVRAETEGSKGREFIGWSAISIIMLVVAIKLFKHHAHRRIIQPVPQNYEIKPQEQQTNASPTQQDVANTQGTESYPELPDFETRK